MRQVHSRQTKEKHMRDFKWLSMVLPAAMAVMLAVATPAFGANATWTGLNANGVWADSANWTAAYPVTGNTATFSGAGNGYVVIDVGTGLLVKTILFDTASAAAYTIGSGGAGVQTLTLNDTGAVTMNAAVVTDQLFNANLALGTAITGTYTFTNNSLTNTLTFAGGVQGGTGGTAAAKTLTITGSGNTAVSGIIANGGSTALALTKTGGGTLTLTGANTYTGITTVGSAPAIGITQGGALLLDTSAGGSLAATSALTLTGGNF
jgi:autotransporter-associated beta strand protein